MNQDILKKFIKKIPSQPGIYLFKDGRKKNLYIGKAINMKNRVKSYLKTDDIRIKKMVESAQTLKSITTQSDIEALILESQMIKKFQPPFNIEMRDDKQNFYVGFSKENFPKIFFTHQTKTWKLKTGNYFIGPFTDGGALKITLRLLRRVFPYCTCKQSHYNYCLNYHIEKCLGICCLKSNQDDMIKIKNYQKNI